MAEYIEREVLIDAMQAYQYDAGKDGFGIMALIGVQPAADVAPVKHGRWIDHMVRDWRCSECGEKIHKVRKVDGYCCDDKPNYCPNCGARMDEEG